MSTARSLSTGRGWQPRQLRGSEAYNYVKQALSNVSGRPSNAVSTPRSGGGSRTPRGGRSARRLGMHDGQVALMQRQQEEANATLLRTRHQFEDRLERERARVRRKEEEYESLVSRSEEEAHRQAVAEGLKSATKLRHAQRQQN